MPLNKQSGNMYEDITHTYNPIGGECEHGCIYCTTPGNKKPVIQNKYSGKPKLIEHEMKTNLGSGNFIFVTNMADLFAENVSDDIIHRVLAHCSHYPNNKYLFQTKNPERFIEFLDYFPPNSVLDTTIETSRYPLDIVNIAVETPKIISKAPSPVDRVNAMLLIKERFPEIPRRITVEPVMPFNLNNLAEMISKIEPEQVYIGANSNLKCNDCQHEYRYRNTSSKSCPKCDSLNITNSDGHPEPTYDKVMDLIELLNGYGIPIIIKKANLSRLK